MGFLRRVLGGVPEPTYTVSVSVSTGSDGHYPEEDDLAVVAVGTAQVPAAIWRNFPRHKEDWTSGIRLEHPATGVWLRETYEFPEPFRQAGARSIAVVGVPHHPDANRDEFGVGRVVRLVPEPANPVDPSAIAVRSADGRYLAGYLPADEVGEVRTAVPPCSVGLVTWENFTLRPRQRVGLRLLIGPSVGLAVAPPNERAREAARREAAFAAGEKEEKRRQKEQERRWEQERAERAAREGQAAEWRAEGRCIDCGAAIEPSGRFVRCPPCREAQRSAAKATPQAPQPERTYANTECPYCRAALDPLPRAKKACPACGQAIYVRSGPDGLTYLLQDGDRHVLDEAWAEQFATRDRARLEADRAAAVAYLEQTLRGLQEAGLRVEILTDAQSCAECRKFRGNVFDARAVPVLPYAHCRNEFCRCDYVAARE